MAKDERKTVTNTIEKKLRFIEGEKYSIVEVVCAWMEDNWPKDDRSCKCGSNRFDVHYDACEGFNLFIKPVCKECGIEKFCQRIPNFYFRK